ncbi:class I SAM-dependent methyltransferase [Paenibacillus azoreducens]|uniref:Methyltransferase n=1 Tax=Paenibacillus azoreducens TaxID=116718 RepID=A0A919Y6L0_9BACL|nr:class I SAM-dependent methyltransferase [Paenibacillus azoreducens]GIO45274.1 methyltransferase [Paenibacillus azoreducens]
MNSMTRDKALQYARYRLPYSIEASKFVIETANVSQGIIADIGSGTGLLTQHFVGEVEKVFAIEPEFEMRKISYELMKQREGIEYIDGVAEETSLPDQSIDLIVAANAYHRFNPEAAIKEFARILKPQGWLAIFSYYDDHNFFRDTMLVCNIAQYNERLAATRHQEPVTYFYGDSAPHRFLFKQEHYETWDEYWGAVVSGMEAPDESEDWFEIFQEAHKQRFNKIASNGQITVRYSTEVWLGQPKYG